MIHSRNLPFLTTLTIFVIAYLLCALQYPAIFSTRVIGNLLTDNAFLGIAAVGMTFVILSGGIDLSIGSVIAFTSVFVAVMVGTYNIHPLLAFAIVLVVSTLFGCLMGAMIRFLAIPPFVVTLAGMFLARGAAPHLHPVRADLASVHRCDTGLLLPLPRRRQADGAGHADASRLCRRHADRQPHPLRRQCLCAWR